MTDATGQGFWFSAIRTYLSEADISASRGRFGQKACVTFQRPADVLVPDAHEYTQPQLAATTGRQRRDAGEPASADAVACTGVALGVAMFVSGALDFACTGVALGVAMFVSGALDFAHPTPTIRQVPIRIALRIEKA